MSETSPRDSKEEREMQVMYWLVLKEIKSRVRVEMSESNEFVRERLV